MNRRTTVKNITIVFALLAVMLIAASSACFAASVPNAKGRVISPDGAVLRKSASVSSKKLRTIGEGTQVTIYKEVFKKKKSRAKKNIWYYVKADGKKGYIRSDLVGDVSYGSIDGKIRSAVNYRKGAGTKMKKAGRFKKKTKVSVCLKASPVASTRGSSRTWYKIARGTSYYYVSSNKVKLTGAASQAAASYFDVPVANMTDEQFDAYLSDQGFPADYKAKLKELHKKHRNWGFAACRTGISWSDAMAKQTKKGVSLVSKSYPASYRSSNTQVETGWYNASSAVVAYFMDPRNFLNENSIYMFEDLSYKPSYQTESVVSAILAPCRLPSLGFTAGVFVSAGARNNVSPVFLAARARQENGSGGAAVNGSSSLGQVYNPFNIGAFGGTDPLYNGLLYAAAKGWNTPAKAVDGGASELAKNYINKGQYTIYYQRFNVRNGASKAGTHQYMTNIMAAYSEAAQTRSSYNAYGVPGQPLIFEIPVYNSMPASTRLP